MWEKNLKCAVGVKLNHVVVHETITTLEINGYFNKTVKMKGKKKTGCRPGKAYGP